MTLKLTVEELRLLATLASDQLFRKEFIEPRTPGYRFNPGEMNLGKALVGRMRLLIEERSPKKTARTGIRLGDALSSPSTMAPPPLRGRRAGGNHNNGSAARRQ